MSGYTDVGGVLAERDSSSTATDAGPPSGTATSVERSDTTSEGRLPFTGTDLLILAGSGLFLAALGWSLRRLSAAPPRSP